MEGGAESLLISSPRMARGAQPYMAQELRGRGELVGFMEWRGGEGRGSLRAAERDERSSELEGSRQRRQDHRGRERELGRAPRGRDVDVVAACRIAGRFVRG